MFKLLSLAVAVGICEASVDTPLPTYFYEGEAIRKSVVVYLSPSDISFSKLDSAILNSANKNSQLVSRVAMMFACPFNKCTTSECFGNSEERIAAGCVDTDDSTFKRRISTLSLKSTVEYFLVMNEGSDSGLALSNIQSELQNPNGLFKNTGAIYIAPTPSPPITHISLTADGICDGDCKTIAIVCSVIGFLILVLIVVASYFCCCKPQKPHIVKVDFEAGHSQQQTGLPPPANEMDDSKQITSVSPDL